jgi:hypothetical protein
MEIQSNTNYYTKYLKYKTKYFNLKNQNNLIHKIYLRHPIQTGGSKLISLETMHEFAELIKTKYLVDDNLISGARIFEKNYLKLTDKLTDCKISNPTSSIVAAILYKNRVFKFPDCNNTNIYSRGKLLSGTHAELKTIISVFGRNIIYNKRSKKWIALYKKSNYDIIIIKPSTIKDKLNLAKPCTECLNMLEDIGIRYVYYSTGNNNDITVEKVSDMVSIFASPEVRNLYFSEIGIDHTNSTNIQKYYDDLIIKNFPKYIHAYNLRNFLFYTTNSFYENYFNGYKMDIIDDIFYIYNKIDQIIISSNIIGI